MTVIENIQDKIDQLKKDEEKMYVGIQFENQLKEKVKDLEVLEQEIDKVINAK